MVYSNLTFSVYPHRPYFITDFVSTVDGKVHVNENGYWPIGSSTDYETFTYLRAHADVIVDGKNTALKFGQATIRTLKSEKFNEYRRILNKSQDVEYIVLSTSYDSQIKDALENPYDFTPTFFYEDLTRLVEYLEEKHHKIVFVDGGPTLIGSLLKQELLDEIFLTISPKLYGSENSKTLSLVEGHLFQPQHIPTLELISAKTHGNEVFLRYKIVHLV